MAAHSRTIAAGGVWLDSEDWCWPAAHAEAVDLAPPAWVPTMPSEPVASLAVELSAALPAVPARAMPVAPASVARRFDVAPPRNIATPRPHRRPTRRRIGVQRLVVCAALAALFA